jgi:hypothetical protein
MADHRDEPGSAGRYAETSDPNLPPNVMVNKRTRNNAFWAYMGPVLVVFAVFAIAMIYWMNHHSPAASDSDRQTIGTSGDGNAGDERREGGFEPQPRPDNTADELNRRGVEKK